MKKGFTLAEILGVIAILGIIITISSTTLISTIRRTEQNTLELQIKNIEIAASNYYISKNYPNIGKITLEELYQQGFINEKDMINPVDDTKLAGCVLITYTNKYNYEYSDICE